MRPLHATLGAVALAAGLLNSLLCGCADPGGLKVSGPAVTPNATPGPVYVAEGPGRPSLRRPATLDAGRSVRLADLRWRSWGGPTAEATGVVLPGDWCGGVCRDAKTPSAGGAAGRTYKVRVTLGGLVRQDRSFYYGMAAVVVEGYPASQPDALRDLRLFVPRAVPRAVPQP